MKTKTGLLIVLLLFINSWFSYSQIIYDHLVYQDDSKSQYFTYNKTTFEYEIKYGGNNGKVTEHSNMGGYFEPMEGITAAYLEFEQDYGDSSFQLYGFLDSNYKVIVPFIYKSVENFLNGVALVTKDDKNYDLIDKTGKQIYSFTAETAFTLGTTYIVVKNNNQFKLIDRTGKYSAISKYEDISISNSATGLVLVKYQNKYGYINQDWQEVIPMIYQNAEPFINDFARVSTGYMWGFIDTTGKVVVPCKYQNVDSFHEGLAAVQQDELWGFIDITGKVVIPLKFLDASYFENGKAPVTSTDGEEYTINLKGERIK